MKLTSQASSSNLPFSVQPFFLISTTWLRMYILGLQVVSTAKSSESSDFCYLSRFRNNDNNKKSPTHRLSSVSVSVSVSSKQRSLKDATSFSPLPFPNYFPFFSLFPFPPCPPPVVTLLHTPQVSAEPSGHLTHHLTRITVLQGPDQDHREVQKTTATRGSRAAVAVRAL